MAKLSNLKTDRDLSENGAWVPWIAGTRLRIARLSNSAFKAMYHRKTKPLERKMREIPDELQEEIIRKCVAHTVLLDWEGFDDDDGSPLEYTPEQGIEMFEDSEWEHLYSFVLETARKDDVYMQEHEEELAGN